MNKFAYRDEDGQYVIPKNAAGKTVKVSIDFREEHQIDVERSFAITRVLHIEPYSGPDVALLEVNWGGSADHPSPVPLSADPPAAGADVAIIGYPAFDSFSTDPALMERIFGGIYDVKRLAPGRVLSSTADDLRYDCTTLGGNSGSVVLDLGSGRAVGLHYAGTYQEANYAVPAAVIRAFLDAHT